MRKYLKFLVLLILICPISIYAKEETTELYSLGGSAGDHYEGVAATLDGGYIAVGYSASTDIDGITNNGGNDAIVVKYDKNGVIEWKKNFGGTTNDRLYKVTQDNNGDYIMVGHFESAIDGIVNKGEDDAIILKLDKNGNLLWIKNYGGMYDDAFLGVTLTADGGYIATGRIYAKDVEGVINYTGGDAVIVKYDTDGKLVWQRTYGGKKYEIFNEVTTTENDEYVAVGYSGSTDIEGITNKGNNDAIIVKFDKDANVIWQKNYGGSKGDFFYKALTTLDGGFIVIGYSDSTIDENTNKGHNDAIIVKYDKDGNVEWHKNYGGSGADYFETVAELTDGSYIAVGHSASTDVENTTNKGGVDYILVKYNTNGEILYQSKSGGNNDDHFKSVTSMPDGGYVAVGHSKSTDLEGLPAKGLNDAIIYRTTVTYEITTKESDNGILEYITDEQNKTKIMVEPKTGYEVDNIIITNSEGEKIEFYEEDGNYYFDLDDDVTIEVIYKEIINPSTGIKNHYLLLGLIITISTVSMVVLRKKKYL